MRCNNDYIRIPAIGLAGAVVFGVLGGLLARTYDRLYKPHSSKFMQDFVAQGSEFKRALTQEEKDSLSGFPNIKKNSVTFLAKGVVKPTDENCKYYECYSQVPRLMYKYDKKTGAHIDIKYIPPYDTKLAQQIWDECHLPVYKCTSMPIIAGQPPVFLGASFNCIGWALGIVTWINPTEISTYVKHGMTRQDAINRFINDKSSIFDLKHINNVDHIIDKLHAINSKPTMPIANNTVAFFFDQKDECQHGARYIETLDNKPVNSWTSKLGANIMIAHDEGDLVGVNSPYGNALEYAIV